ncbi:MAG: HTTM domain-containing protein [Bacteroidota bacterium]
MRARILTIATLAFLLIICFFIDGDLLFGKSGIINGEINEGDLKVFQVSIYKISSFFGLEQNVTLKLLILAFAGCFFSIVMDKLLVLSSIGMWFIYWVICNSGIGYAYGADYFMIFFLYYNIILCVFRNKKSIHKYLLLMLQLHLCMVYFFAGLGKIVGTDWWDGNAMWAVINVYSFDFVKGYAEILLNYSSILVFLSVATILVEILYPFLIFYRPTRKFTLFSVIAMHIGIAGVMGLFTFGVVMTVMNLVAFGHYLNIKVPFKLPKDVDINLETAPA